jgi:thermostable 8-oxoguanine DNA glycosylase
VLDTHILQWLRDHGVDAPAATPQNMTKYRALEEQALALMQQHFPGKSVADADLQIWKQQSGRTKEKK